MRVLAIYKGLRTGLTLTDVRRANQRSMIVFLECMLLKFGWVSFIMNGFRAHTPNERSVPCLKAWKARFKKEWRWTGK